MQRIGAAVLAHFQATGEGWQERMGRFLASNAAVLRLIAGNESLLDDMDAMLVFFRTGELRIVFESNDRTVERVERNVRETVRGLREQLDITA